MDRLVKYSLKLAKGTIFQCKKYSTTLGNWNNRTLYLCHFFYTNSTSYSHIYVIVSFFYSPLSEYTKAISILWSKPVLTDLVFMSPLLLTTINTKLFLVLFNLAFPSSLLLTTLNKRMWQSLWLLGPLPTLSYIGAHIGIGFWLLLRMVLLTF